MAGGGVEDTAMLAMRTARGALVSFHETFNAPFNRTSVEVHGTAGSLFAVDCMTQAPKGTVELRDKDGARQLPLPTRTSTPAACAASSTRRAAATPSLHRPRRGALARRGAGRARVRPHRPPRHRPGGLVTRIAHLESGFYKVPLPVVLTDSTHGEMRAFELVTVRLRDDQGARASATPSPSAATGPRSTPRWSATSPTSWRARTPT
jgi:hypothetical protein